MPNEFSLSNIQQRDTASANLAGVAEVSPAHALIGLNGAPLADIPASVGMRSPEVVQGLVDQRTQQTALDHPAVQAWAANAEPAHLAVAKDDLPGLAKVADYMKGVFGPSFRDIHDAYLAAEGQVKLGQKQFGANLTTGNVLPGVGNQLLGTLGMAGAVFAPINQSIKRALVLDPSVNLRDVIRNPDGSITNSPVLTDPVDRERRAQDWANLATFMLLGPKPWRLEVSAGKLSTAASPFALRLEGPGVAEGRMPGPGVNPNTDTLRTVVAEADIVHVAEVQASVATSPIHAQAPSVMENFLEQQTPGRTVFVDPEELLRLGAEGTEVFPTHGPAIIQAARDGELFEVPYSTYLARTAGQPFAEKLNAVTNFREGNLSVNEGKETGAPLEAPVQVTIKASIPPDFTPAEATAARFIAASAHSELDSIVAELRLRELFTEAKAVGSTKTNFERYSAGVEEQISLAKERLTAKAVAQLRRERTPQWAEAVAQRSAEVEGQLAVRPEIAAWTALTTGKTPLGAPHEAPFKFDRAEAIAQYGQDLGLPSSMFRAKGGMTADEAAEVFGFPTGADLIRALAAIHTEVGDAPFSKWFPALVKAHAGEAARAELGFGVTPDELHAAASEAIATPVIEDFLASDLKAFAEEHELPFDKEATAAFAAARFSERPVKVAINIKQLETFLGRDNRKLETALLKGDIPAAFKWKQAQYLHQLELGRAHKFLKTWNRAGRNITRWAKKKSLKSMSQPYLDRIQSVLVNFGVGLKRDVPELQRAIGAEPLDTWIAARRAEGQDITPLSVNPAPMGGLTVGDFTSLYNTLTSIAKYGMREADQTVPFAAEEAVVAAANLPNRPQTGQLGDWKPAFGALKSTTRGVDARHSIMESLFELLDGGIDGPHHQMLMIPATNAANMADRLEQEIYAPIVHAYEALPKAVKRTYSQLLPDSPLLNPHTGEPIPFHRTDILPLLANLGTKANATKLAEGYGTTVEAIEAFIGKHITIEETQFIQFIWDQMTEKLFPLADDNARKLRGYGITKELPREVQVGGFRLKGGYYPLDYDPKFTTLIERGPTTESFFVKPFSAVTTPTGFEQERTAYVGPLNLSLDRVVRDHMRDVITRVAYGEFVDSARRFISNRTIRTLWNQKLGHEYYRELMPWLERQVMDVGLGDVDQQILARLRRNMITAYMGFKWSVGVAQMQGALPVISEIGLRWTLDGYYSFLADAVTGRMNRNIYALSEEMKYRHLNLEQNVRDVQHALSRMDATVTPPQQALRNVSEASMKFINFMDKWTVSGAAWKGAYNKARWEMRMSEGDAVRYADKVVRKTQGTGRIKDLPAVQKPGNEFQRALVFAYTWPGRLYNLQKEAVRDLRAGNFRRGFRKAFWLFAGIPVIAALATGDWPEDKDRDDPRAWFLWTLRKVTLGAVGNSVWTRDLAQSADRVLAGKSPFTTGASAYSRFGDAIFGDYGVANGRSQRSWFRAWVNLLGFLGLPGAGQLGATGQFAIDVKTKKQKPKSPKDWLDGLTTGRVTK